MRRIWKELPWPNRGVIPAFTWRDWQKPRKASTRTAGVRAEIRTEYLLNTPTYVTQQVNKFLPFYETRSFITVSKNVCHTIILRASCIQSTPYFLINHFNIILPAMNEVPEWSPFLQDFRFFLRLSRFSTRVTWPAHLNLAANSKLNILYCVYHIPKLGQLCQYNY